jgi:RNA polymerase sigma factor (sigma-70 family)
MRRQGARGVRIDMARCDEATARVLLQAHASLIDRMARDFPWGEAEELVAIGRIAVIEAHLSYQGARGVPMRSWITQVIRWRMSELGQRAAVLRSSEVELDESDAITNGHHDPSLAFFRTRLLDLIDELSPRHQAVISGRLRGETFEQIADSLGLSRSRVEQDEKAAIQHLRQLDEDV